MSDMTLVDDCANGNFNPEMLDNIAFDILDINTTLSYNDGPNSRIN